MDKHDNNISDFKGCVHPRRQAGSEAFPTAAGRRRTSQDQSHVMCSAELVGQFITEQLFGNSSIVTLVEHLSYKYMTFIGRITGRSTFLWRIFPPSAAGPT